MTEYSLIMIITSFVIAVAAIYILYSIIIFQGTANGRGEDLQLSTKKILEQVQILFDKKEYALVQLLATKYLDRVPGHYEVRVFLARAYYEDKKYNQAIKQCIIILAKKPNSVETRQILGDCYIKKNSLPRAEHEYEFVYSQRKKDPEVVRTLAELYRNTDKLYSSIEMYGILSDLMTNDEDIADIQSTLAELNEETHNYPAAFEAYKRRLGIYPKDIETNQKLIELHLKIKNYPTAIETLLFMESFVSDAKTLLWIYETLISLYENTEDYEKAIEYSEKMMDVQGADRFQIRNQIALYELKLNKVNNAISILSDLAMMSQDGFEVTLELAEAYIINKEYTKALERYQVLLDKATQQEAKAVNLLLCDLYVTWAIDSSSQGLYKDAFEQLKNAAQYNPISSKIYYNTAINQCKLNNYTSAIESLGKALEYVKDDSEKIQYLLLLADAHHQLGNFFEEKKALSDLLKNDENNPEGLYRVGLMYAVQHDIKKAEDAFKKALKFAPEHINAKYNLALLYENNNKEKAKELYMEVLEQDPTFVEAQNALIDISAIDAF